MAIGMLRRHYDRLHDENAQPGAVEGDFHHPAEDPKAVEAVKAEKKAVKVEKAKEHAEDEAEFEKEKK